MRADRAIVPRAFPADLSDSEASLKEERKPRLMAPTRMPDRWPKNEAFGTMI